MAAVRKVMVTQTAAIFTASEDLRALLPIAIPRLVIKMRSKPQILGYTTSLQAIPYLHNDLGAKNAKMFLFAAIFTPFAIVWLTYVSI